jgi:hypothetical protein
VPASREWGAGQKQKGGPMTRREVWLLIATYIALVVAVITAAAVLGRLL